MEESNKNLFYLHDLSDYKVASGYSDVRGWDVKDADGRTVGKVEGLMVSKKDERVVYLDVKVDESVIEKGHEVYSATANSGVHEFLNKEGDDHLIIPIGLADLDENNKTVYSNKINHDTFARTKRYNTSTGVDRGYELVVYSQYHPDMTFTDSDDEFYNRDAFYR